MALDCEFFLALGFVGSPGHHRWAYSLGLRKGREGKGAGKHKKG